jgi:hypothetical protein
MIMLMIAASRAIATPDATGVASFDSYRRDFVKGLAVLLDNDKQACKRSDVMPTKQQHHLTLLE